MLINEYDPILLAAGRGQKIGLIADGEGGSVEVSEVHQSD